MRALNRNPFSRPSGWQAYSAFHFHEIVPCCTQLNDPGSIPVVRSRDALRATGPDDSLPTRRSLLSRLRDFSDSDSWRTFFDTYWRLIYNLARKSGLSDSDAQDVVQETVIAVARKMPDFRYDPAKGSFKQWLLLITRRRIQDHLRRLYRSLPLQDGPPRHQAGGVEEVPAPALTPDVQMDAEWEQEWQENLFNVALTRVRHRANPKSFQVFDYCVLQDLPARQVAKMLGLNAAQVYLAKHRMSAAVKRTVKELEAEIGRSDSK